MFYGYLEFVSFESRLSMADKYVMFYNHWHVLITNFHILSNIFLRLSQGKKAGRNSSYQLGVNHRDSSFENLKSSDKHILISGTGFFALKQSGIISKSTSYIQHWKKPVIITKMRFLSPYACETTGRFYAQGCLKQFSKKLIQKTICRRERELISWAK